MYQKQLIWKCTQAVWTLRPESWKSDFIIGRNYGSNNSTTSCGSVFHSRQVLLADGSINDAGIVVNSMGKIFEIIPGKDAENYAKMKKLNYENFGSRTIWPGIVDTHVHMGEPGTEWEGFERATKAAAWGGVTTIVDMPMGSIPPTTTVENLKAKLKAGIGKTYVDVAFWGGIVPDNSEHLLDLLKAGVRGFKCFLIQSGDRAFPNVTKDDLETALDILKKTKSVILYHAELPDDGSKCRKSGINPEKYTTYLKARPQNMEINAVKLIIDLTEKFNVRSHIAHVSSANCFRKLKANKCKGLPITVETCPHYLTFSSENIKDGQTEYKCAPPIRNQNNQDALWEAVKQGDIHTIASDHEPSVGILRGKCPDCKPDFLNAKGGIVGLQFLLSALWTKALEKNIPMATISKLLSENPAKLANLNCKGSIAVGKDADLIVWDPDRKFEVKKDIIIHKDKHTPYLGMTLKGKVTTTVLRGQIIYRAGESVIGPCGKYLLESYC